MTPEEVQAHLRELGVEVDLLRFEESTRTAQEAADAIGCKLGQIVKSLCFTIDGAPVVILTAGDRRVDDRKVAALYDVGRKKVRIASAETTREATGYAPGGVAPIGHKDDLPILIDASLARFETVYAAAGSAHANFAIRYTTLVDITGGRVTEIT